MNDPVRAQYERWIYPEPIADLAAPGVPLRLDGGDPDVLGRAYWPDRPLREDLHILVAGCGANAAARIAFRHPKATVVGIDLSEASLAHERHLKARHRLDNLTLRRCRIEDAQELDRTFDLIDSSGVLHHLPDPAAGLKSLAGLLRPDGVVFLMLYGKYGRAGAYMAQEIFRALGVGQSPDDVAFVKQALASFKVDHPVSVYRATAEDLGYDAGIVDTFLHPQDRPFTVAACLELVDAAGLAFQGWMDNFYYYPEWQMPRDSALFRRLEKLPDHELWQVMELFHGRIARHCFYACRRDRDPRTYRIGFDDDRFMHRVPILRCKLVQGTDSVALERPPLPKIPLRGAHAAIARLIDGRRTVLACFREAGLRAESPEVATSFCRGMFRDLWRLGYCFLVDPAAVAR
ncbi:MAG: class I SAM-dependent methyltransferase [Pseudomonadota bacterium]